MMPIISRPEPKDFDAEVRRPGQSFLRHHPNPSTRDWNSNRYWKKAHNWMYSSYDGICAYSGEWIAKPASIDHFLPKNRHPYLAYEWSNYRLSSPRLNQYKDDYEGLIDPFSVNSGWFVLELPSCLIRPGDGLSAKEKKKIEKTIRILRLNDDDDLVQNRCNMLVYLAKGDISLNFLRAKYPYLVSEITRQGLLDKIKTFFLPEG